MSEREQLPEVVQHYYSGCRHVVRTPTPAEGVTRVRVIAFLDSGGLCPRCEHERGVAKKARVTM